MELTDTQQVEQLIDRALAEDLGRGDITTEALVPDDQQGKASEKRWHSQYCG